MKKQQSNKVKTTLVIKHFYAEEKIIEEKLLTLIETEINRVESAILDA